LRAGLLGAFLVLTLTVSAFAGPREVRGAKPGAFDLYILALSWSPGFCASNARASDSDQCAVGANLGFVAHGLWPQYESDYPAFCGNPNRSVRASDLDIVDGIIPTRGLARHQWRKHGSCTGLSPSAYFRDVADAFNAVVRPDSAIGQAGTMRPIEVEQAFVAVNPGLRTDMIAVDCGRAEDGTVVLQEVRVCLTRDLRRFRPCPAEVERDTCRAPTISIPEPN
jgi:ribonuclease T2